LNVRERATQIKGILYSHCQNIIRNVPAFKTNESRKFRDGGTISFEEMEFIDGSLLNFFGKRYGEIQSSFGTKFNYTPSLANEALSRSKSRCSQSF